MLGGLGVGGAIRDALLIKRKLNKVSDLPRQVAVLFLCQRDNSRTDIRLQSQRNRGIGIQFCTRLPGHLSSSLCIESISQVYAQSIQIVAIIFQRRYNHYSILRSEGDMVRWSVDVGDGRTWDVGASQGALRAEVIIPLDQIDGMSDEAIGATVRLLTHEADMALALDIAASCLTNHRAYPQSDRFHAEYAALLRHADESPKINEAIRVYEKAIEKLNREQARRTPKQSLDSSGWIYILKAGPFYKIGRSGTLDRRLLTLSIQLPFRADLIFTKHVTDMVKAERYLHQMFAHKRSNGEWFELDDADLAAIRAEYED